MTIENAATRAARRNAIVAFTVITLALLAAGSAVYRQEAERIRKSQYAFLRSISELKAGQIEQWRKERSADARRLAQGLDLKLALAGIPASDTSFHHRDELLQRFKLEQTVGGCQNVILLRADGRFLLTTETNPAPLNPATLRVVSAAITNSDAVLSDFFREPDGRIYIDTAMAVRDDRGEPLAVVALRYDAGDFLYPLIQSWPTPSRTAETLLVQQTGQEVVFLNELRHRTNTALNLRFPLTRPDVPAVQAVLGRQGRFEGRDYRGVEALSDLKPVRGSPWFVVAKMDNHEIFADLRFRAGVTVSIVGMLILLAAVVVAFFYRRWQAREFRFLYETERGRREAEEIFRTTLYSIGDAVIATDTKGVVQRMNPVAETLTGWTELDARGRPLDEIFRILSGTASQTAVNPVETVLREGRVVTLANNTFLIARNGIQRPIADSAAPIRREDGTVAGVVLVFSDQTERYEAKQALRKSQAQLRTLVQTIPDLVWLKDPDGVYLSCNSRFEQLYGATETAICGRTDYDFVPKETADSFRERDRQSVEAGKPTMNEETLTFVTGGYQGVFETVKTPMVDDEGRLVGVLGVARDITFRKQAEEDLRQSEAFIRAVMDSLPIGVAVNSVDPTTRFTYMNDNFPKCYRTTREALATTDGFWEAVYEEPDYREKMKKRVLDDCASGDPAKMHWTDIAISRRGAETTFVSAMNTPVPGKALMISIVWDVTERKKIEAQFLRAQRMEAIGALASGIAHDLNNILAPVLMIAPLLRDAVPDPDSRAMLDTITGCAQRGADIIKQLLIFGRGSSGVRAPLPVRHLLRDMTKFIQETFPRDIHPHLVAAQDLWPLLGDATQIHQALMNLCVNARDAMPEGGTLTMAAKNVTVDSVFAAIAPEAKPGLYVCVSVTDTGTGITPQNLEHIFDPFFTTKETGKGTGLGLATVLGIVRGHEGFVRVESVPGSGTTFDLYFPASPGAKPVPAESPNEPPPRGQGELILVVDDESTVRDSLRRTLESHGYQVLAATHGKEGLSVFERHRDGIRAVLTDMMMPVMGGPAMITALRALDPKVEVLGMSGLPERRGVKGLEQVEISAMLTKPFDGGDLLRTLRATLDRSHQSGGSH